MAQKIRVGVVGVGYLGRFHAQKYAAMDDVSLVGVVDTDLARATLIAEETCTQAFTDYTALVGKVDAVSIVTPTKYHFQVGRFFLENNIDVMMEKPITKTLEEADTLVALAEEKGCVLQVGLLERFNPGFRAAEQRLSLPIFIEAKRLGTFNMRGTDVDVALDLMIHDLDIILSIIKSPVTSVCAVGAPVLTPLNDIINAHLIFANGCTANITASRVSNIVERKMSIYQPGECLTVDFGSRQCYSTQYIERENEVFPYPQQVKYVRSTPGDSIQLELLDFIRCVKERCQPTVTGSQGRESLAIALEVVAAVEKSNVTILENLKKVGIHSLPSFLHALPKREGSD